MKITIPEAARMVNLTPAALYVAIARGNLKVTKQYGRLLVSDEAVKKYLETRQIGRPKNGRKHG